MTRPYIVCHMLTSINGKISGDYMSSKYAKSGSKAYETINESYHSQAWLCGRVTMEENFTNFQKPVIKDDYKIYPREDFVAVSDAEMYIVSADPSGKVGWESNSINYSDRPNAHIIEILTNKASDGYVAFLRDKNISYIFAGEERINCTLASEKLYELFAIKTLMVSGGGVINCSFLDEGIIDEVSIVMVPVTDGKRETNTIFENANEEKTMTPIGFNLEKVEIIEKDTLWLTYLAI
ncbi:TPA: RibD family protein [Enterococcus faecalis]|uniref:dihydrofolate reductase family protein n=1 Tax=Enterococcus sp. DIV0086 TaxID=2774655 RepID=UPI002987525A|nr:RibD family protein [Enterococcus faecalis]HBI1662577.1 RibD family protein [Enterococcus faecalis]HBI1691420.1 RibD family protein [Enterococcus faecalis]HBI1697222.1 RibD family protein [Enterococcus faecalis]HBI1699981.1 RibD family protein [Enterococcus faecalis]